MPSSNGNYERGGGGGGCYCNRSVTFVKVGNKLELKLCIKDLYGTCALLDTLYGHVIVNRNF